MNGFSGLCKKGGKRASSYIPTLSLQQKLTIITKYEDQSPSEGLKSDVYEFPCTLETIWIKKSSKNQKFLIWLVINDVIWLMNRLT